MAVLNFTLSEDGVGALRDALICLNKFSDDVSLEARKDSFVLTTLNSSKSAYASFRFATNRFFSRYAYQGTGEYRERFYCSLYIRALISLFRSRSSTESGPEKQTPIDKCDVAIEDGEGVKSRFIARIVFRNGLTSTHRLSYEVAVPVHAKFNRQESPHHWTMSSKTLRQLMDHFGPGVEFLDINTNGNLVNFTCFSEKKVAPDAVLTKPLQTSIAVEADEFDDIDVEDKLHIVISVKDFRAIIQHAGITGNDLSARYSLPARPIQLTYSSDGISCEFLIMTVGERGSNPAQKTRKGRKAAAQAAAPPLEATSRRASMAPSEGPQRPAPAQHMPTPMIPSHPTPSVNSGRANVSRTGVFDLRPSQRPNPPPTMRSESLFVEDEGWEPVQEEDGHDDYGDDNARLGWDDSADQVPSITHVGRTERQTAEPEPTPEPTRAFEQEQTQDVGEMSLVPTQKLSDVESLALFPD
ncbi:hypothetical protein S7711_03305 [Stachybotrys chartarum IBT 7711]|uniref:DNA repair protein rad9 n=1 Tax=Stachybotrys chartarum (strain CBS 109288 / IBT 7711) TaxID=1280523 RepID=A0A084AUL9_STACB|nr:hypothetical protein S7711_03305 [Stachybotrys chartarum IBT 7711]